jgi:hypothetical protein
MVMRLNFALKYKVMNYFTYLLFKCYHRGNGFCGYILPDECPPSSAKELSSAISFFRFVSTNPPTAQDFISYWHLFPQKRGSLPECKARAISIFETQQSCEKMKKLTIFKGKIVCRVNLSIESGMVERDKPGHCSWWMAKDFDPLQHCEIL